MKCLHNDGYYIEDRNELKKIEELVFSSTGTYGNNIKIKVKCNNLDCNKEKIIKLSIEEI